jgi:hypothetical protein
METTPVDTVKILGRKVSNCILENSMCLVVGLGIGTALSIQRRNLRPFVMGCTIGTMCDMAYGYCIVCRPLIDDYNKALKAQKP